MKHLREQQQRKLDFGQYVEHARDCLISADHIRQKSPWFQFLSYCIKGKEIKPKKIEANKENKKVKNKSKSMGKRYS